MTMKTAIILCTYNGERFLKEQLESFAHQSLKEWELFVYDDGSTDQTSQMITQFQQAHPQNPVHWCPNSQKRGFAQNFIQGIINAPDHFDYYALSDQDDIWCENKLSRAADYLKTIPANMPAVYCTRTTLVDSSAKEIGLSPLFTKPPSFNNALMQSIAGGNTMVLNRAARELLVKSDTTGDVVSHDWFIYQLVAGAGGIMHYDGHSEILYRQHDSNIIGSNLGFFARLSRMFNLFNGSFKIWTDKNLKMLNKNKGLLTAENQALLNQFEKGRKQPLFVRPFTFCKLGLYRQKSIDTLALYVAWVIGKL